LEFLLVGKPKSDQGTFPLPLDASAASDGASFEPIQHAALDQFGRLIERISRHPSLDNDQKAATFNSMLSSLLQATSLIVSAAYNTTDLVKNEVNETKPNSFDKDSSALYKPEAMSGLENIERLLHAANELMKREPSLDREALEHIRRLRVKIRFAMSSSIADGDNPIKAPELWKDRADKNEDPVAFIKRVYAKYLGEGISRADISRLDKRLYNSLNTSIHRHGDSLSDVLPTKSVIIDKKLKEAGEFKPPSRFVKIDELSPTERERLRLYAVKRSRKGRAPS
jgi:hypothetical protein